MAAPIAGVCVSIEAVSENQIQEVTLDGQEIYTQSLSMSENLSKLAHKIDFSDDCKDGKKKVPMDTEDETDNQKKMAQFQPSLWPWDSVRNKLKSALAEVSVLSDVLKIAKEKRYMVLDPVQPETPEQKLSTFAKKKSLQAASAILVDGAERLKQSQTGQIQTEADFHKELMDLRQAWRLKKVGNMILGDLSYKSAGSRYWQSGTFEVMKEEESSDGTGCALQVVVPADLEGVAFLQVCVQTSTDLAQLMTTQLTVPTGMHSHLSDNDHWSQKLKAAQNVIFCKELFSQLTREAVQTKAAVPHMVIGNRIISTLFPGVQLSISLCRYTDRDNKKMLPQLNNDHRHVLEHSLHRLLTDIYYSNITRAMPHPVTATLGMSRKRRVAGPRGASTQEMLNMIESETILEKIIKQARHAELRTSTMNTVDEMAQNVPDPQIVAHWSAWSESLECSCRITITSMGYENYRTCFSIRIGTDCLKIVCKDGKCLTLSYEQQELKDFLLSQLAQHQVLVIQNLTKATGWHIMSASLNIGIGDTEEKGNVSSLLIASPPGGAVIAIRSGPASGQSVHIQTLPRETGGSTAIVNDPKWNNLGGEFKEIDIEKLEGKNFADRIELLMASYSCV